MADNDIGREFRVQRPRHQDVETVGALTLCQHCAKPESLHGLMKRSSTTIAGLCHRSSLSQVTGSGRPRFQTGASRPKQWGIRDTEVCTHTPVNTRTPVDKVRLRLPSARWLYHVDQDSGRSEYLEIIACKSCIELKRRRWHLGGTTDPTTAKSIEASPSHALQ